MAHPNLPPAGTYLIEAGEVLPEWFRIYISAPWPMFSKMRLDVDEFGRVTLNRAVGERLEIAPTKND